MCVCVRCVIVHKGGGVWVCVRCVISVKGADLFLQNEQFLDGYHFLLALP